jgi:DNA ligase-associated metallophosphoesterase
MDGHAFTLNDARLIARPGGALWWPAERTLAVADLHLGKSRRLARRGGALLPPYETAETLARLDGEIAACAPLRVICLGDSFDDMQAGDEMDEPDRLWLLRLMAGRDWLWIAGNHDPAPLSVPGTALAEWHGHGLVFRHIAQGAPGEVSGHHHPKWSATGRMRPCFLLTGRGVILPAFGAYTGGLAADDPSLAALCGPGTLAVLTGARAILLPVLPRRR